MGSTNQEDEMLNCIHCNKSIPASQVKDKNVPVCKACAGGQGKMVNEWDQHTLRTFSQDITSWCRDMTCTTFRPLDETPKRCLSEYDAWLFLLNKFYQHKINWPITLILGNRPVKSPESCRSLQKFSGVSLNPVKAPKSPEIWLHFFI